MHYVQILLLAITPLLLHPGEVREANKWLQGYKLYCSCFMLICTQSFYFKVLQSHTHTFINKDIIFDTHNCT